MVDSSGSLEPVDPHLSNDGFGGRGEGVYLTPKMQNKLIRMAVRNRWKISKKDQQKAIEVTAANMLAEDGRVSNGAVKNMLAMLAQNQKLVEVISEPKAVQHEHHVSGGLVLATVREEVLNDRSILEALRNHQSDGHAGIVCSDGGQTLEAGQASQVPRPGTNGHANGNGRH